MGCWGGEGHWPDSGVGVRSLFGPDQGSVLRLVLGPSPCHSPPPFPHLTLSTNSVLSVSLGPQSAGPQAPPSTRPVTPRRRHKHPETSHACTLTQAHTLTRTHACAPRRCGARAACRREGRRLRLRPGVGFPGERQHPAARLLRGAPSGRARPARPRPPRTQPHLPQALAGEGSGRRRTALPGQPWNREPRVRGGLGAPGGGGQPSPHPHRPHRWGGSSAEERSPGPCHPRALPCRGPFTASPSSCTLLPGTGHPRPALPPGLLWL